MTKKMLALLVISLVFNLVLGAVVMYQNYTIPTAEALNDIKVPGTYGPPAMEIIDDDMEISTTDVVLQNTLITGDLYLSEIDGGTITLEQVEVQGEIIIGSKSEFTLSLSKCSVAGIAVTPNDGAVTIVAKDSTVVDNVEIASEASLQEDGDTDDSQGFKNVQIKTDKKVILVGQFASVDIANKEANVRVLKGEITTIDIQQAATDAELHLAKDVQVEKLALNAITILTGEGTVQIIDVNVPGLIKLQGVLGEVACQAEGIFLELNAGSIDMLLVPEMEATTSISLAGDTYVESMELNAKTGITGKGQIGTASIKHSDVSIDQTPAQIDIEEDLIARIGGEEYQVEPEPEQEPEQKSYVNIKSINNITLVAGKTGTRSISVYPSGANLSVSSSNNSVAGVSLSGKTINITAKKKGTATITVKGSRSGYVTDTV